MVNKNREMLEKNLDSSVENTLEIEKKWVSQLRENYASGSENLRKQFDELVSQAAESTTTKK
jgi:hypothetical protein